MDFSDWDVSKQLRKGKKKDWQSGLSGRAPV
jgi:hypothetical protein